MEPADGTLPPLTPEAERKRQLAPRGTYGDGPFDGPEDFTMYDRCLTLGVVGSMTPKIYGNGHRIVQGPGYVAIMNEMIHEARMIPLDGRPHAGKSLQMYMGDGRGHWEGQTLVVETTNLNGKTGYSDVEAKLVERITRVEPDVLRYEVTVDAPRTYTAAGEDFNSLDIASRLPSASVRMPRGQSCAHAGAQWSTRRGQGARGRFEERRRPRAQASPKRLDGRWHSCR